MVTCHPSPSILIIFISNKTIHLPKINKTTSTTSGYYQPCGQKIVVSMKFIAQKFDVTPSSNPGLATFCICSLLAW